MAQQVDPVTSVGSSSSKESLSQQLLKKQMQGIDELRQKEESQTEQALNQTPKWEESLTMKHAATHYSCYMICLNAINHMSLDHSQAQMQAEADLMNCEHEIQEKLLSISNFFSYVKGNAVSDGAAVSSFGGQVYNPNAMNGLKYNADDPSGNVYKIQNDDTNPLTGRGSDNEIVSSDYAQQVQSFVKAFKELFYSNTDTTTPTFDQVTSIDNPSVLPSGKNFDLTSYWTTLNNQYSSYNRTVDGVTYNVFATQPGQHISLIQEYCYLKAQVATFTGSKDNINAANGDISKLVNFNITDTKNCDASLLSMFGVVRDLENQQMVSRGNSNLPAFAEATQSGLYLILSNQLTAFSDKIGPNQDLGSSVSGKQVGLYGYFSYMAFNEFWEKNPNATLDMPSSKVLPNPEIIPSFRIYEWKAANQQGVPKSDDLTSVTLAVNSNQTNMGQAVGDDSVTIQSVTTNEGQDVNIVQTGLQGKKQADSTMLQNQLSS